MPIRTILVPVAGTDAAKSALETAFLVGRQLAAHVEVFHVRADSRDAVPLLGEGMSGAMIEEMIDVAETEAGERAAKARAMFDETLSRHSVPVADRAPGPDGVSTAWIEEQGREDEAVARRGRLADLIVVGRPNGDSELSSTVTLNAGLFESGRPVLVVPPEAPRALGRKIAVWWNGSGESARAVGAALPFLAAAEKVVVLSAESDRTPPAVASDLAAYLAWHGIEAATRSVSPEGGPVGEALLSASTEAGADLLVMGAYTHSRLRQLILGGVTRHVLAEAAIPVLMAH